VHVVDATYPIDLMKDDPGARSKAAALSTSAQPVGIAASALAEVLVGAHFVGGRHLRRTLELVAEFEVLTADTEVAHEAGRIGAQMRKIGNALSASDLLVAATCTLGQQILVSRDEKFTRVPGLPVERY
jgi:predicted nucleic acid-binding protein